MHISVTHSAANFVILELVEMVICWSTLLNLVMKYLFRLVQVAHPNVLVLVEHLARELNNAEFLVSRSNTGKRCRAPMRNRYQTLKQETKRLQEMYVNGEVLGGTMGYLKQMGYMSHRALDEFIKVRRIEATEAIEAREVTEEEAV